MLILGAYAFLAIDKSHDILSDAINIVTVFSKKKKKC